MGWSHAEKIFDPVSDYTLQAVWGGALYKGTGGGGVYPGVDRRRPQQSCRTIPSVAPCHYWPLARWPVLCPAARRIGFTELIFRLTSGSQRGNIRQQPLSSMIHSKWE